MPAALLHPGVYIEEVSSGVRTITGVATSIALFIGWAPKGPVDRAMRITNFSDYERAYGGLHTDSPLSYGVRHFFANGGSDAYILRVVDTTPGTGAEAASVTVGDLTVTASSPGDWGETISFEISAVSGTHFRLDVLGPGAAVLESYPNVTLDPADPRSVGNVINGRSAYIVTSVAAAPATPAAGTSALANGRDGDALQPADTAFQTAVEDLFDIGAAADRIDLFNIICVPGLTDTTSALLGTLQRIAKERRAFLLVDSEDGETVDNLNTNGLAAALTGPDADHSAFYFPWVMAPDPMKANAITAFPPSGFIAGILARTDAARGVWKAPAGTEAGISGAIGLALTMSDAENGQLNPKGINCLRTFPVYGNVVWGARTLHGDNDRGSEWKYVPVRRMALFLEESLYRGTQWVVFEPNDEPLWSQIRLNIGAFMQGLFRQGAFQGTTPKDAYFVKCDRETTTQADINLGIVNILVGFAPLKPAEFVVIKIQQMAGEIQT
jgi:Bacteriophage tail sheath protein